MNLAFARTPNGAQVDDLFMRLIRTCQSRVAKSLDYLVKMQAPRPGSGRPSAKWMPWNDRDTLAQIDSSWR